ncbi:MAG: response regulator, partial [bacterium]|nr:response regulator [bacterium]
LVEDGYNSVEAENGKKALEILKYQDFDVIFSDIMMPLMDGLTFLTKLNEMKCDIPVIILTMLDSAECAVTALKRGAFAFCKKPVDVKEIKRMAQKGIELKRYRDNLLSIQSYMSSSITFRIPGHWKYVSAVLDETIKLMKQAGIDSDRIAMVKNAVNEAVLNAVVHGCKGDEQKIVIVKFELTADAIKIMVMDNGGGFDFKTRVQACEMDILKEEKGKGIFIMTCNMDSVLYNNKGNIVRLTKKIK